MKFDNKKIKTKDGRDCILTPNTPDHAEEMIPFLKQISTETPFLMRNPDEVDFTIEKETEILSELYESERSVMMLAVVEGKLAGNCAINPVGARRRVSHRCSMAISLTKEYWGLGIGHEMINYLLELARRMGYEQIELEYVSGNERAKILYEKCGFHEVGRVPNAMKYDDGTYRDEIKMVRKL